MVMQAATVEVLVTKAKFEPAVALAVAEAIDMAIAESQLVTIPVLDARFSVLEARIDAKFSASDTKMQAIKAELVRWVFLVMLGNVALTAGITAILNALQR